MEPDVKRTLIAMYREKTGATRRRARPGWRSSRPTIATCWTCGRAADPRRRDAPRSLRRIKLAATLLLVCTAALFVVARHYEPLHWAWGYVAAFAAAATVGGLADWYAVVALFRRPLGLPIPHTAIIPRNHHRIADNLGELHRDQFPGARAGRGAAARGRLRRPGRRLAERSRTQRRARGLHAAAPAADPVGHRPVRAARASSASASMAELERVELAPLAAGLLSAVTEKGRHQRLLDELLGALREGADQRGDAGGAAREDPRRSCRRCSISIAPTPICCARSWPRPRRSSRRRAPTRAIRCAASSTVS